jgi:uncharacterized membrane protein
MTPFFVPTVLVVVAIPMVLGIVPRNGLYGFRTGYTMSSDIVWRRANRIGGIALLVAGLFWLSLVLVLPAKMASSAEAFAAALSLGRIALVLAVAIAFFLVYRDRPST